MLRLILVLSLSVAALGQLEEAHPAPEPYSFAFSSPNEDGTSSSREETGDASGRITGSYTILGADGQQRRVEYVADQDGFRANVITNEIGTESQNPGDVNIVSSAPTAAELSAQWEASGAGRARLAAPAGLIGARGVVGINRGLVAAPVAPLAPAVAVAPAGPAIVAGGLLPGRNLRLGGFGIRAQGIAPAAIGAPIGAAIGGPIGGLAIQKEVVAAPVGIAAAPVGIAAGPVGGIAAVRNIQVATGPRLTGLGLAGVAPVGLNTLNLGVAPSFGGLALRGNGLALGGLPEADANVLLLSRGGQLSGASKLAARKY